MAKLFAFLLDTNCPFFMPFVPYASYSKKVGEVPENLVSNFGFPARAFYDFVNSLTVFTIRKVNVDVDEFHGHPLISLLIRDSFTWG